MRRRKRSPKHINHERWLVSYADFITLLFAVFVVMYAASQVDHRKISQLSQAIQSAFQDLGVFQTAHRPEIDKSRLLPSSAPDSDKPDPEFDTTELRKTLALALAPEIAKKQAELRDGPDGLVLSLQEIGFYNPGSDVLKESSTTILGKVAAALKTTKLRIRIEGHTDDVPIHNARFASNWELSSSRATGLVRLFIERFHYDPARLAAAGYAEYHPIQSNSSAEGRSMNRRVDIVVLAASRRPVSLANEHDLKQPQPTNQLKPGIVVDSSSPNPSPGQ